MLSKLREIDDIVGDFTEFNGNTFVCNDPVALSKAIEQYVIKAIPKKKRLTGHEQDEKRKGFNECIAELKKGLE
jgi:hypothetical protein